MIKAELIVEVDGREEYRGESRSFLQNFGKVLALFLSSPGYTPDSMGPITQTSVTYIDGTPVTVYGEWYATDTGGGGGAHLAMSAPDNDDTYGIVVGSGTATVTPTNYCLASKIPHGTGPGQLDYGVSVAEDLGLDTGVTPPVYRFRITRTFSNLSGAAININEVCVVAVDFWRDRYSTVSDPKFLIARDVLPSTYTVPNGGTATVVVTFEVVVG